MLTVNTNVASLNAQRNLGINQQSLNQSMQRLSSGLRINSAADDAAGLAISSGMNAQVISMNQDVRNANDAVSFTQVADGALSQIGNLLTTMRSLATEAATGTVSIAQRGYLNSEFGRLAQEITRIASATQFNGIHMLNGKSTSLIIQVGTTSASYDQITVSTAAMGASALGVMNGKTTIDIGHATSAQAMQALIDKALSTVNAQRANLGSVQNRFQIVISNLQTSIQNTTSAMSQIQDADIAAETANLTRANILSQAGASILAQANQAPQLALKLLQ
jgi:flagellin